MCAGSGQRGAAVIGVIAVLAVVALVCVQAGRVGGLALGDAARERADAEAWAGAEWGLAWALGTPLPSPVEIPDTASTKRAMVEGVRVPSGEGRPEPACGDVLPPRVWTDEGPGYRRIVSVGYGCGGARRALLVEMPATDE